MPTCRKRICWRPFDRRTCRFDCIPCSTAPPRRSLQHVRRCDCVYTGFGRWCAEVRSWHYFEASTHHHHDAMNDKPLPEEEDRKLKRTMHWTLVFAALFAALLPFAYWIWFSVVNHIPAERSDTAKWGAFGDFVGGLLNPVVAFLALFWLTRSITIQREELRDTKRALGDQAETAKKQNFEGTFFSLLDQHNKVLESLQHAEKDRDGASWTRIKFIHLEVFRGMNSLSTANYRLKKFDGEVGHYFRILYQIFKFISINAPGTNLSSDFSGDALLATAPSKSEKLYSNIVRSFLSEKVAQLLAVNCYCNNPQSTYWAYKCLVERYAILEHMPFDVDGQLNSALDETRKHFDVRAFGGSEFVASLNIGQKAGVDPNPL